MGIGLLYLGEQVKIGNERLDQRDVQDKVNRSLYLHFPKSADLFVLDTVANELDDRFYLVAVLGLVDVALDGEREDLLSDDPLAENLFFYVGLDNR